MVLEYLEIQTRYRAMLVLFSQSAPNRVFLALNGIKACLRHDLSARLNMKSKLAIKFPAPGRTKFIKFPPSRAGKDIKCPGGGLVHKFCGVAKLTCKRRDTQLYCLISNREGLGTSL